MSGDCHTPRQTRARRQLIWFLRILGTLDLSALAVCFLPGYSIDLLHQAAGLGSFPAAPIAGYLARSASAMYALHGLTILYISGDIERFHGLIRFLACLALGHGVLLCGIDVALGLPGWWILIEGPAFAATGAVVLALLWRMESKATL